MRDVLPTLEGWIAAGRRFATATVTQTWGSSPRPVGAVMGIREDGLVCGSVSGGCVESAVIEASLAALEDGETRELTFEAIDEESLWDVGLSCGGRIQIWIDPDPIGRNPARWAAITDRVRADQPAVLIVSQRPYAQLLWSPGDPDPLGGAVKAAYRQRASQQVEYAGIRLFLNVLARREKLVIVGAVHIAVPLVQMAGMLGFETILVDPRSALANLERFSTPPDRIVMEWPEAALEGIELGPDTYAVVLTHDPKIDDVALAVLLKSPVAYIGALGSRVTQGKRRATLLAQGFTETDLDRIHGPIGLNIGARSPEEIALSIMAEIVQVRRSGQDA